MPSLERTADITASAERVFAYVDDIRNLARHMSESRSMPMMGSKLKLEILTPASTGVGATYRYSGRMLGLTLDFSEMVTKYIPGRGKIWHTIGDPQLLIVSNYEMGLTVNPMSADVCRLTIAFDYELPRSMVGRLLGRALAGSYARWCLDSMVQGTKRDVEASGSKT